MLDKLLKICKRELDIGLLLLFKNWTKE